MREKTLWYFWVKVMLKQTGADWLKIVGHWLVEEWSVLINQSALSTQSNGQILRCNHKEIYTESLLNFLSARSFKIRASAS